jgi:SAM-dependent methyltransferase
MPEIIDRSEGRRLFGLDPDGYDEARPDYPEPLYAFLVEHGAIARGTATLEIGAGPGLATRRLIALGADPLTVVEPDERFAPSLRTLACESAGALRCVAAPFEETHFATGEFALVCAATSYHWLDPRVALSTIARVTRPGGWVALWWNVFGDADRADPFHDATQALLADAAIGPSGAPDATPFPLDRDARIAEVRRSGAFDEPLCAEWRWTLVLDGTRVGKLYQSFSHVQRMPTAVRARLLGQLVEIAETRFGGRVERNMVTPIYLARRNAFSI